MKALLVRCPFVQWQPDGLTTHTEKWSLGDRFLGVPTISSTLPLELSETTPELFDTGAVGANRRIQRSSGGLNPCHVHPDAGPCQVHPNLCQVSADRSGDPGRFSDRSDSLLCSELHKKGHMTTGHRLFCEAFLCFNTMPCPHLPRLVHF